MTTLQKYKIGNSVVELPVAITHSLKNYANSIVQVETTRSRGQCVESSKSYHQLCFRNLMIALYRERKKYLKSLEEVKSLRREIKELRS